LRCLDESGKNADSVVSTDSTGGVCLHLKCVNKQSMLLVRLRMKNLGTIVVGAKEKIHVNNVTKSCQIVPPIPDTTSQIQPVVAHIDRITSENMAMKIIIFDEYSDRDSRKLNLIFHNVPESLAAQQSERVSDDVKFVTNIAKNIGVKEFDLVNAVRLGSQLPNKLRLL